MKTVVGLYDDFARAHHALEALRDAGFTSDNISLVHRDAQNEYSKHFDKKQTEEDVSGGAATGAGIGAVLGGLGGFLASIGALAIPGIGPILAAGPILATLTGAGIGAVTGGLLGALADWGIPEEEASLYAEAVRRGGTLVMVQAADHDADRAADILNRYDPVDLERRAANWRESNWTRFDDKQEAWDYDQIQADRVRYGDNIPVTGEEDIDYTPTETSQGSLDGSFQDVDRMPRRGHSVRTYDIVDRKRRM